MHIRHITVIFIITIICIVSLLYHNYIQYISNVKNIILSENRLFIYYEYKFSILYLIFKIVCTYVGIRYICIFPNMNRNE